MVLKLYRQQNGRVSHYHEAWISGSSVIEYWGALGERGQMRRHKLDRRLSQEENLQRVLAPAFARGFERIDYGDHARCMVEYAVVGMGSGADVDKRHALEERLNEMLGWNGLGHCDGGSIGSGTMEVCCYVVDYPLAADIIARDLAGTEFADYTRIYDEKRS